MKRCMIFVLLVLALPQPAWARDWTVDYANSHLTFTAMQGNSAFSGSFRKFAAQIDLDPDHPDAGKIMAIIDMVSATAGSDERDSYLPQPDWFNTAKFPQATFVSSAIRKTGDTAYTANGTLTIKGIAQPVALVFTLLPEQDPARQGKWRAKGQVMLKRADYHIGEGEWASETYVKQPVEVDFDILAAPADAAK